MSQVCSKYIVTRSSKNYVITKSTTEETQNVHVEQLNQHTPYVTKVTMTVYLVIDIFVVRTAGRTFALCAQNLKSHFVEKYSKLTCILILFRNDSLPHT